MFHFRPNTGRVDIPPEEFSFQIPLFCLVYASLRGTQWPRVGLE